MKFANSYDHSNACMEKSKKSHEKRQYCEMTKICNKLNLKHMYNVCIEFNE